MERKFKITIPEPCHENWDKMTPNENGHFCLSCAKTVIDFTEMLPQEIQHFFIQNQNNKICGRFKKSQLDSIIIQIPSQVLHTQTHYHKMFLLALFIAMGTTLFSCQDRDGNKNRIDKIEIVDNTNQDQNETNNSCYGHQIESKKVESKKTHEETIVGALLIPNSIEQGTFKYDIIHSSKDLDVSPVPENGMKKFYAYFYKNYPVSTKTDKFQGKIVFVVEKDGSLSNFNIVENTGTGNGEEAIKVLKTAPKWIPGKHNSHIVRSSYILPIPFIQ
ncbi:energy transducer TonB [Flavobacterium sp. KJJ]|uniref:energy transducer TonB n=1 Tax=Flavobacterium sp. KJJ TaxID=1270193 RepID=UPI00049359D8|nr:energy transducer TonB [Flavobacterium sp. KJJ]